MTLCGIVSKNENKLTKRQESKSNMRWLITILLFCMLTTTVQSKEYVSRLRYYIYPNKQLKDKYTEQLNHHNWLRWDRDNEDITEACIMKSVYFLEVWVPGYLFLPSTMQYVLLDMTVVYGQFEMLWSYSHIMRACYQRDYSRLINDLGEMKNRSIYNPDRIDVHMKYLHYNRLNNVLIF